MMNNDQIDINLLVPYYLMSSYLYYKECVSAMTDTIFDKLCVLLYDNFENITHAHKIYIDKESLKAGTGYDLKWDELPQRIISAARTWYRDGAPMPNLNVIKKKGETMEQRVFILSANDNDAIIASKILTLVYPDAIHMSSSRVNIDFPPGSIIILVRAYMGVERIIQLSKLYTVKIYDLTISEEYRNVTKLMNIDSCESYFAEKNDTVSEFIWNMYFQDKPLPDIITLVRDYMRWELKFDESILMHHALEITTPFGNVNNELFTSLLKNDKDTLSFMIEKGRKIEEYVTTIHNELSKELSFETNIENVPVLAANISGVSSLFFKHLQYAHYDMCMIFSYDPTVNKVKHTLYGISPDIDVSDFAKRLGGGGHKGAAGFVHDVVVFKTTENVFSLDTNYRKIYEASMSSDTVLEYVKRKIHGYQRNAFYGTWKGKSAVFYNSPHLVASDFFEKIRTKDCELKITFCMVSSGMYRIAVQSVNDMPLSEEYGIPIGKYYIEILPYMTHAKFSNNRGQDIFINTCHPDSSNI